MSTPLTLITTIAAAPGHTEALERELRALVAPSRAEAGCLQYDLHQDRHDSHLFYMIEQWRDDAALERHQNTEHFLRFSRGNEALLQNVKIDQLYRLA